MASKLNRYNEPQWITPNLINWMIDLCKRAPARIKYLDQAKDFRNWYKGDRFLAPVEGRDDVEIDDRNATARRNIIGETVDELGSVLLKNNPIIRRKPYLPWHRDLADDLDATWNWQWLECGGQGIFRAMMEDAQLTGLSCLKIIWDPHVKYPGREGVIRLYPQNEHSVLVDPYASNCQRGTDARFIIHHVRKLPEEIIAKFGKRGAEALGYPSGAPRQGSWNYANDMMGMSNTELTKPYSGPRMPAGMSVNAEEAHIDPLEAAKKDVYETWIFPQTMYANDLLTGEELDVKEYRYGAVATMVENQIVKVKPNPLFARKRLTLQDEMGAEGKRVVEVGPRRHPFIFLWWKRTADERGNRTFYNCMGMVEWMTSIQFSYNAIRRNIRIIATSLANPAIAYNEDMLDMDPTQLKMIPGQLIKVTSGAPIENAIRPFFPGAIPPELFRLTQDDERAMREAGAVKPGLTGLFPEGGGTSHTPAATIGSLQESAFGPLWRYVDEMDDALVDISSVMDGYIQLKYQPGHYMVTSRRGREFWLDWTGEHAAAQFQRHVVAGATTPVYDLEKEQREAFVMEKTQEAMLSNDPRIVRLVLIYLRSLYNFPWAYQYEQELQSELMRLEQMTPGLQGIGAQAMGNQLRSQLALPEAAGAGNSEIDEEGVNAVLAKIGMTPEQFNSIGT